MVNRLKSKSLVALSTALILLSAAVFVLGIVINGFSSFSLLFLLPFLLMCCLAVFLTAAVARTSRPVVRQRAVPETGETEVRSDSSPVQPDESGKGTDRVSTILSETAGELRTSVGAIQEELDEIVEEDEAAGSSEQVQSLYEETDRL